MSRKGQWVGVAVAAALLVPIGGFAMRPASPNPVRTLSNVRGVLNVDGLSVPFSVFAVAVDPGKTLDFSVSGESRAIAARAAGGRLSREAPARWRWSAPSKPGLYPIELNVPDSSWRVRLNAFVKVPASETVDGRLHGYRIGRYPAEPLNGEAIYDPPDGFVRVTPENENTRLSPHFRLRQFLCKEPGHFPKYVVLSERLIFKLESLRAFLAARGVPVDGIRIMSGYRTPAYNAAIGNVPYSRHLWGDAADIFIDADGDGIMDDLNGDGRHDIGDSRYLASLVADFTSLPAYASLKGGLGDYHATSAHGPFVHIDARGWPARW